MSFVEGETVLDTRGRERLVGWSSGPRVALVPVGMTGADLQAKLTASFEFYHEDELRPRPRTLPAQAMEHQVKGVEWLDKVKAGLLADEPGLGKTFQACVAADGRVVVLCPAAMRVEWQREFARWRPELTSHVISGTKPVDFALIWQFDVLIINYDILPAHIDQLLKLEIRTVIADEAQALKTMRQKGKGKQLEGSKRAIAAAALCAHCTHKRFMLSATPVMNRVRELWSLLHLIDPSRWSSFQEFGMRYCAGKLVKQPRRGGPPRMVWDFDGASNTDELHRILKSRYMLRRTKDILSLPPKSRKTVMVSLKTDDAREYSRAANDFLGWVKEKGGVAAVIRAEMAETMVKMTSLRHLVATMKLDLAVDWILNHAEGTGRPLVVMAHHRDVTEGLVERLRATEYDAPDGRRKFRVGAILGGMGEKQRTADKDAFQDGQLDVIVCSIMAAGVGLTLTRATETLFVERAWRPSDLVQAEDRIWRIGTKNACTITYLDAEGTIDCALGETLVDKQSTVAAVVDGLDVGEEDAARLVLHTVFGDVQELTETLGQLRLPKIDWLSGGLC